ncbi:hypothetical protein B446_33485 [Streptomyces collinus Tu 365]|uniref:Uncharacterized protein n=1 Tax=Streptomyces collinus (strain DSM 40733 / Tue 365) TaxID=1214242 RepID=S5UK17_STRC3|nr:hypothetical protein B446_01805 [Streptomyces collinus Tu 365]AGS73501.1 hypothetical protein B446_33485 [Streptomyces collinus Tu 365]
MYGGGIVDGKQGSAARFSEAGTAISVVDPRTVSAKPRTFSVTRRLLDAGGTSRAGDEWSGMRLDVRST